MQILKGVADDYETDDEYQADLAEFVEETTELTEKYQKGEIEMFALVGNRGVSLSYRRADAGADSTATAETPLNKLQNQDQRNKEIAIEKSIADTKELIEDKYYLTDEDRWTLAYNLTEEKKTIIKRDFILSNLKDAQRGNYTAVMLFNYAEQHAEDKVNEIKDTHDAVYQKRHTRILEKITAIETAV